MEHAAPEAAPEAAVDAERATPPPTETASLPPPPSTVKGTIQTTLELAFPDLYNATLLPSDVLNQRLRAEEAAEEEYKFQLAQRELRKSEQAVTAPVNAVSTDVAQAAGAAAAAADAPAVTDAETAPEAELVKPTIPEFVLPTLPDEFAAQRRSIQSELGAH